MDYAYRRRVWKEDDLPAANINSKWVSLLFHDDRMRIDVGVRPSFPIPMTLTSLLHLEGNIPVFPLYLRSAKFPSPPIYLSLPSPILLLLLSSIHRSVLSRSVQLLNKRVG